MGIGCGRGRGCGSVGGYGCVCARGCVGVCMCRERAGVGSSASKARDIRATEQRCAGSSSSSSRSQSRVSEGRRAYLFFLLEPASLDGWMRNHVAKLVVFTSSGARWESDFAELEMAAAAAAAAADSSSSSSSSAESAPLLHLPLLRAHLPTHTHTHTHSPSLHKVHITDTDRKRENNTLAVLHPSRCLPNK